MIAMRRVAFLALGCVALCGAVGCSREPAPTSVTATPMATAAAASEPAPAGAPAEPPLASASPAPEPPSDARRAEASQPAAPKARRPTEATPAPPLDRPGLGTQWGETRTSRMSFVGFERADVSSPFATAALFYNDEEGARAMTSRSGFRRTPAGPFTVANGLVSVGLRDDAGRFFSGFVAGGRNYAVGESGRAYAIVLHNNTSLRIEVVLSVDGLDVRDGRAAGFAKRGYILEPRAELDIDGFRQSVDEVAAFRFGSVRGSYVGLTTGDTRNVGVIGVALFNERGTNPAQWTADEVQRRRDANPFPGQFAMRP
jgi:hypothetical protein